MVSLIQQDGRSSPQRGMGGGTIQMGREGRHLSLLSPDPPCSPAKSVLIFSPTNGHDGEAAGARTQIWVI